MMRALLLKMPLLLPILRCAKNYLKNLKFFFWFAGQSFKKGCIVGGVFMILIAPFISAGRLREKPLAYRGEVPEFHYTLS